MQVDERFMIATRVPVDYSIIKFQMLGNLIHSWKCRTFIYDLTINDKGIH